MNVRYRLTSTALLISFLLFAFPLLADDRAPSGTLVIDETQVMVLVGGDIGGGTLLLDDSSHSFKTEGIKLGGFGIHKVHLVGKVYQLSTIEDFPGVYVAAEAGITIGKGKGGLVLQNEKGVVIHLKANAEGVALNLGVEGIEITMGK